jgi:hypothetical protein
MANTLTALAPTLFSAAQEVSAEPFGVISAINANFSDKGVAIGDKVTVPVAPTRAAKTYSPSMNPNNGTAGDDAIASSVDVAITASRYVDFHLTGEQERSLQNGGNDREWLRQIIAQGMRTLRNEAEAAAALAVKQGASRAIGTAGATPFSANLDMLVEGRALLRANGAPLADPQLVLAPASVINLQKLAIYQSAEQAGSPEERRSGLLGRQFGFAIRDSAQIALHTKGTATSFDEDLVAGYDIGDRIIHVDGGDGGSILAGDVVTWVGDANKYINGKAFAALVEEDLTLNRPGLRATLANAVEGTIGANYTPNLMFERNAVVGVMRPPLIPASPLIEQIPISDGKGMTYLLARVVGDGMVTWRLHLAFGFKVVQEEHVGIILG